MLNETGSRLIGQAAYGPGWKRRLIEMNVELSGEDNPIARVVAARTPLFIKNPAEALQGYGFRKFFSTLEIHSIVFVPIMADMQVIGVLAVQPSQDEEALDSERMTLLSSLADEIASVVLTKRLEERVNEGDKMRAAGLLAAGIAHNFNNLLQAILGQASLADIQKNDPGAVGRAAKIIIEAAGKGSSLVKQLLSFAHLEYPSRRRLLMLMRCYRELQLSWPVCCGPARSCGSILKKVFRKVRLIRSSYRVLLRASSRMPANRWARTER